MYMTKRCKMSVVVVKWNGFVAWKGVGKLKNISTESSMH